MYERAQGCWDLGGAEMLRFLNKMMLMIILVKMSRVSPVGKQLVAWEGGQFRTGSLGASTLSQQCSVGCIEVQFENWEGGDLHPNTQTQRTPSDSIADPDTWCTTTTSSKPKFFQQNKPYFFPFKAIQSLRDVYHINMAKHKF